MDKQLLELKRAIYGALSLKLAPGDRRVGVYEYIPQNTPYPFIHLGGSLMTVKASKTHSNLSILQVITVYSDEASSDGLINLGLEIRRILCLQKLIGNVNVSFINAELKQKKDGKTSCLNIKFKFDLMGGKNVYLLRK